MLKKEAIIAITPLKDRDEEVSRWHIDGQSYKNLNIACFYGSRYTETSVEKNIKKR